MREPAWARRPLKGQRPWHRATRMASGQQHEHLYH